MLRREITVKWFDAKRGSVLLESPRRHERDGSESPDVAIMKRAAVGEIESKRRITKLALVEVVTGVDQQRPRKSGLNDHSISAREIEHNEFRSSPGAIDRRAHHALPQCDRGDLAKDVGFRNGDGDDARSGDLAIQIARDRLGFR